MRAFKFAMLLAGIASSQALPTSKRQTATNNATAELLEALNGAKLGELSTFLASNDVVIQQVMASSGLKTLLAPTNEAMKGIPAYCRNNSTCYQGTILMHFLNGTFNVNEYQPNPMHTVGHSFLTNNHYANLPGGNGQAVALSIARYPNVGGSIDASYVNNVAITNTGLEVGNVDLSQAASTARIQEALNVDHFVPISPIQSGNISIQPVYRAMTIPGGPLATLRILGGYSRFIKQIESQANNLTDTINGMRGVTIFAPTNDAWQEFEDSAESDNITGSQMTALILNHMVAYRAVYSPLLRDQGSMVTMAGQDIAFSSSGNSVTVGSNTANISQFDIMHRGGVIHSIDSVLANINFDSQRASQAANSSLNSAIAGIAGPISLQNAASSQGNQVPISTTPTDGQMNANSTIKADEYNGSTAATTQQSNGARQISIPSTCALLTVILSLLLQ